MNKSIENLYGRQQIGRVALQSPLKIDALRLGKKFPTLYFTTGATSDGSFYTAETRPDHSVGRTVMFFLDPSPQGFSEVYSPLSPNHLSDILDKVFQPNKGASIRDRFFTGRVKGKIEKAFGLSKA